MTMYVKHQEMQKRVEEAKAVVRQDEEVIRQVEAENAAYEKELLQASKAADSLHAQFNELKEIRHQLKDILQETQYKTMNALDDVRRFRDLLQFDHDQAKRNIQQLQDALEQNRAMAQNAEQTRQTLLNQCVNMEKVKKVSRFYFSFYSLGGFV